MLDRNVRRWGMGKGKNENFFAPPSPLSFLLSIVHPLGRTFFLSPVFHCMKNSRRRLNRLQKSQIHNSARIHPGKVDTAMLLCNVISFVHFQKWHCAGVIIVHLFGYLIAACAKSSGEAARRESENCKSFS